MFTFKSFAVLVTLVVSSVAIPMPDAGAGGFTLQNGKDAVALNDKFQSLNANSKCTDGDDACIGGKFGQCTAGKFALTTCGAGTVCAALPLVNKPGTAVTCTTAADRDARIAATGASGGAGADNGADSGAANVAADPSPTADAAPAASSAAAAAAPADNSAPSAGAAGDTKPFTLKNGQDAQAQNAKSATLTPDSPCTDGENACINQQFAQCANGKFVLTPCGGGLQCFALPLLNKPGISNTCVTEAEAAQRIKNSGAGSLDGN